MTEFSAVQLKMHAIDMGVEQFPVQQGEDVLDFIYIHLFTLHLSDIQSYCTRH